MKTIVVWLLITVYQPTGQVEGLVYETEDTCNLHMSMLEKSESFILPQCQPTYLITDLEEVTPL